MASRHTMRVCADSRVPGMTGVEAADGFAALADPVRLAIVRVLADGERCVCDVKEQGPVAGNLLSYHLRILRAPGLVSATRRELTHRADNPRRCAPGSGPPMSTVVGMFLARRT